jgi:helix-turn-helix protein
VRAALRLVPTAEAERCQDLMNEIGIKYLEAIDDWKAPFEVAAIVGDDRALKTVSATLHSLVGRGLAEYGRANNTFRLTRLGREIVNDARTSRKPKA